MIILRDKNFGIAGLTGIANLGKAFGAAGKGLSTGQKLWEGTKGVAKIGAIGAVGTAAVGGAKYVGSSKKALEGEMGNENGAGY